jgi:hypothetical protein
MMKKTFITLMLLSITLAMAAQRTSTMGWSSCIRLWADVVFKPADMGSMKLN